jgi:hypothetical protein
MAGTMTRAFADNPLFAGARPWLLQPLFWLQLLVGEWRANSSGRAVCGITTGSVTTRVKSSLASALILAVAVLLVAFENVTWPIIIVLAVISCLCLPTVRRSAAGIRPRRQLRRARPRGHFVTVHSVASVEPGAGRALLQALNTEADRRNWTLVLDTANEALESYYAQLGYVRLAAPVQMPTGARSVPMARTPRPAEVISL